MIAYINAKIINVNDPEISKGLLLVNNGVIEYVGEYRDFADEYKVVDCNNKYILPGFIDSHTHVGNWGEGTGDYDGNESTNPITPAVRAFDSINIEHSSFRDALDGGVTTVCVTPGSGNNIGGQMCAIKTGGDNLDSMLLKNYVGMKAALGENPKRFYGQVKNTFPSTRMGNAHAIRKTLAKVQDLISKEKDVDYELKPLIDVLECKVPLRVHAHRADDILTAIRIAEEFSIDLQIEHGTDSARIADYLAKKKVKVNLGPSFWNRAKVETQSVSFKTAAVLAKSGVEFSLISDHPFYPIQFTNIALSLAHAEGLTREQALRAYTLTPAKFLGVDDRVGSLEKGKDADFTIWDGDPFSIYSKLESTYINGIRY